MQSASKLYEQTMQQVVESNLTNAWAPSKNHKCLHGVLNVFCGFETETCIQHPKLHPELHPKA